MSVTRSPTGSGFSGIGRSDSQPNLTSSNVLTISDPNRMMLRSKRKQTDDNQITREDFSEMQKQMSQIMAMITALSMNQKDSMDNLLRDITQIKENIVEIKSTTDNLISEQNMMKQDIQNLSTKNTSTEQKLETVESDIKLLKATIKETCSSTSSLEIQEGIMAEINDRELRSRNIIVIGIPEPESLQKLQEKMISDNSEIIKITKIIIPDCPEPVKVLRLGKFSPGKSRPLKVCFNSHEIVKSILRERVNLTKDGIKMYSDQTPKQQEHLKNLKAELKHRTESGEKSLTIKYIKGVPKIIEHDAKNMLKERQRIENCSKNFKE